MKFCVIGNSHAAALKSGIKSPAAPKVPYLDFWVIGGANQPAVIFEGGRIRPAPGKLQVRPISTIPEAAENGLDITPYEAVIISACGLGAARNPLIARDPTAHPLGHQACREWLGDSKAEVPAEVQIVSPVQFEANVRARLAAHPTMCLARLLSQHFFGRVLLQPWPAPSSAFRESKSWFLYRRYGEEGALRAWRAFFSAQVRSLDDIASELGGRFEVMDYPLPGIRESGFLPPEYSAPDPWHANAEYGALVLEQIEARRERMLRGG